MDITEIQDELLRLEYPNLLPDHDPDIERYYYLRSLGQSRDALDIYQNRLRVRYPNDDFRTWLLRSYRSHDPAFRGLLAKGYRLLGARSLERVKQILLFIAERAEAYNEKDIYSTIKTAEDILKFLPPERYEAVAGMERYLRYATVLELKVKSITKATELVRAYLTDTLSVVEEERRRRSEAQRQMAEDELQRLVQEDWDSYYNQKKYGVHTPLIDLSTVVFSSEDLARIEIPPFRRIEDQILGYCIKYWNMVDDPAFERILFLYSRKYGRKNYDVYMAIRRGRQTRQRDDELLASIMSVLITGYYYSIQGDLYLQRNWNTIKAALFSPKALPAPAAEKPEPKQVEDKTAKRAVVKRKAKKAVKEKATKEKTVSVKAVKVSAPKIAPQPKSKTAPKIAPKSFRLKSRPAAVVAKPKSSGNSGALSPMPVKPVKVPYKLKPAPETKTTIVVAKPIPPKPVVSAPPPKPAAPPVKPVEYKPAPFVTSSAPPSRPKQRVFTNKTLKKAKGSVSDRLKKLSGRSYDVYEDRFLAKARNAIRKILGTGRGLFFNLPEEAEDLVYNFLRDHYSDPYMDWEDSMDRKNLAAMGFELSSLNPVIDECYRVL